MIAVLTASFADEPHNHFDSGITARSVAFPASCWQGSDHIELAMFHPFLFEPAQFQFTAAVNRDVCCAMA
jgi:hypothetical protein